MTINYCPICGCVLNEKNKGNEYYKYYYGKEVCCHCEKVIKKINNFNKKSRRRFAKKNLRENFEKMTLQKFYELNNFFGGNKTTFVSAVTGRELDFEDMFFDHIVPICKGGTNNIHNIIIIERYINDSKDDKDIDELGLPKTIINKIHQWQTM